MEKDIEIWMVHPFFAERYLDPEKVNEIKLKDISRPNKGNFCRLSDIILPDKTEKEQNKLLDIYRRYLENITYLSDQNSIDIVWLSQYCDCEKKEAIVVNEELLQKYGIKHKNIELTVNGIGAIANKIEVEPKIKSISGKKIIFGGSFAEQCVRGIAMYVKNNNDVYLTKDATLFSKSLEEAVKIWQDWGIDVKVITIEDILNGKV